MLAEDVCFIGREEFPQGLMPGLSDFLMSERKLLPPKPNLTPKRYLMG